VARGWLDHSQQHTQPRARALAGPLVIGVLESVRHLRSYPDGRALLKYTVRFAAAGGPEHDAQVFTVSGTALFPVAEVEYHKEGALVPVRYEPGQPTNAVVVVDADPEAVRRATSQYLLASGRATPREVSIRDKGVLATGVVLASRPTGQLVGRDAVVQTQVQVTRADQSTFQVVTTQPVAQSGIPRTMPGSVVDVRYLPHDEQAAVVDFEPNTQT